MTHYMFFAIWSPSFTVSAVSSLSCLVPFGRSDNSARWEPDPSKGSIYELSVEPGASDLSSFVRVTSPARPPKYDHIIVHNGHVRTRHPCHV